jgi:hypothetical protein
MKFWQLVSIFRSEPNILEQLLQDSKWLPYLRWFRDFKQYVDAQDRSVLDADIPTDLTESAMKLCSHRFRIQNGYLYLCADQRVDALSSTDVCDRYDAEVIEEVLEYGSFRIPVG